VPKNLANSHKNSNRSFKDRTTDDDDPFNLSLENPNNQGGKSVEYSSLMNNVSGSHKNLYDINKSG